MDFLLAKSTLSARGIGVTETELEYVFSFPLTSASDLSADISDLLGSDLDASTKELLIARFIKDINRALLISLLE